jgi:hypothetical protein
MMQWEELARLTAVELRCRIGVRNIKDQAREGLLATCGSPRYRHFIAEHDAAVVALAPRRWNALSRAIRNRAGRVPATRCCGGPPEARIDYHLPATLP